MKIICVGRNYAEHARELQNEVPDKPVVFLKPPTALLKDNKPFYYPEWTRELHHEAEVVLRICRQGKYIQEQFAHKYFDQVTVGVDFTARDLQHALKAKGLPWEIAKAFDHSAVVGVFKPLTALPEWERNGIRFSLHKNGKPVQQGDTRDMLFSFGAIIAYCSQFFTLQAGDLIYTGTPPGVGPVEREDRLEGFLEDEKVFDFYIK
ncbi:MAG: fumarylacetoacetate hydrolase family protein [Chitinophagales bacterium]|nr:fumarylacetoacetate hydrolase family protein [Chitinophagales bacterium]MDW8418431.1 fumarylacetoacetate hydrolase family protein [Chitinophagales bacterium]